MDAVGHINILNYNQLSACQSFGLRVQSEGDSIGDVLEYTCMYYETLCVVVFRSRFCTDRNADILKLKHIEQQRNLDESIFKKINEFHPHY